MTYLKRTYPEPDCHSVHEAGFCGFPAHGRLRDQTCCIVLDGNDELAGFGITIPSISVGLQKAKGHMFLIGWYHLLKALKTYDYLDLMINGAVPKWQNTGISAVIHMDMSRKYRALGVKWDITNPQIETNGAAHVWDRNENELWMRRRCYIKNLV